MTSAPASPVTSKRPLRPRRVRFSYPTGTRRRHFVNGDLVFSHMVAVLSAMFPEGEEFFIRSVRNVRDRITDPELADQVRGFIGQEASHGREHRLLNERLQAMGYPTARVDRHSRQLLQLVERAFPKEMTLAATAALEHYTATLAETVLTDERALAMLGTSEVRPMLLWHALEESEHKAVAFDVYRTTGGPEWLRIAVMDIASVIFWTEVFVQTARSLLHDPAAYQPLRLLRSLNDLRRSPLFNRDAVRRYLSYHRVGFHPDDWDATEVIERWTAELFGAEGTPRPHAS